MAGKDSFDQQVDDAEFLAGEFGVPPQRAGELVARAGVDPDKLRKAVDAKAQQDDPLSEVPKPAEPATDQTTDVDEERLKPVLHKKNNRVGGG